MTLLYQPRSAPPPTQPVELPRSLDAGEDDPASYIAEEGLAHAVDTALLLGRPLLVTGEPGTGKTQLAASVAFQLGYGKPLRFVAKSISQAPDLFYTFDSIGHFKAAQAPGARRHDGPIEDRAAVEFIRYNALGQAILFANPPEHVSALLPQSMRHPGQRRSVVLLDEVDKAPRDFPNDLLSELERMEFRIAELGAEVRAAPDWRPVVIITSNSERGLPDAFLRRCIYYDIPFPTRERLEVILQAKLTRYYDPAFVADALEVLGLLRDERARLGKKPSTAELIGWMIVLLLRAAREPAAAGVDPAQLGNPLRDRRLALQTLGVLVKSRDDLERARRVIEHWALRS